MLTRRARGVLVEDIVQTLLAELDADSKEARMLRPLQTAAVTYRIAFGPRAGRKKLTLQGAVIRATAARQPLCADIDGFSLHAAAPVEAHDHNRLEQLCRYITVLPSALAASAAKRSWFFSTSITSTMFFGS